MYGSFKAHLNGQLDEIRQGGLEKPERVLGTPQGVRIRLADGREALNFCANNYLGLANDPRIIEAAKAGLDTWGYGLSSVRFICGTQELHKRLENAISEFLGTEDTILYSSCFDANGGLFETLLGERGRGHQRRAEPRQHHRRHPSLQGPALPLQEQRPGGPGGEAQSRPKRPASS